MSLFRSPNKRKSLVYSLCGVFLMGFCASAQAKSYTYRAEAEVQVTHPEDESLGLYLAEQVARRRAYEQGEALLLQQAFLKGARLSAQDRYALSVDLANTALFYASSESNNLLFKGKVSYDSIKFPETYATYYVTHFGDLLTRGYEYNYHQELTHQIADFLARMNTTTDINAVRLLRVTEGNKWFKKVTAERFFKEAVELRDGERIEKSFERIQQAIDLEPDYLVYPLFKMSLLIQQYKANDDNKKLDQAIVLASELIEKSPEKGLLYIIRASLYLYQDVIPAQGISDVEQAIALQEKGKGSELTAPYYMILGIIAKRSEKHALSREAFQKACDLGFASFCNAEVDAKIELQ